MSKITSQQLKELFDLLEQRNVENDYYMATLSQYGYENARDIKQEDFENIMKQFKFFVRR